MVRLDGGWPPPSVGSRWRVRKYDAVGRGVMVVGAPGQALWTESNGHVMVCWGWV